VAVVAIPAVVVAAEAAEAEAAVVATSKFAPEQAGPTRG